MFHLPIPPRLERTIAIVAFPLLVVLPIAIALQDTTAAAAVQGYTSGEILTFIAAGGALLTALVGTLVTGIVTVIVAWRTGAKTDGLVVQLDQVHKATNSGLDDVKAEVVAMKAELAIATALNESLRDVIADLKVERGQAALLAAREMPIVVPVAPVVNHEPSSAHLKQIESNTAETVDVLKDQGKD